MDVYGTYNYTYLLLAMAISGTDWLEVPTIYKAYFWGLNFREYHNSYGQKYGIKSVPPSIGSSWCK